MAHGRKAPKKMAHVGPNMTPMVDVVMCILIFFMLGSTFLMPELFLTSNMPAIDKVGLGQEQGNQKLPAVRMNIVMRRQGNDTWVSAFDSALLKMNKIDDSDQADNEKILTFFEQKKNGVGGTPISNDVQIIIMPDRLVPYQDVITIYDYCAKAKFSQVAFAPAR
jgi:biopolymer transport protein ExbD